MKLIRFIFLIGIICFQGCTEQRHVSKKPVEENTPVLEEKEIHSFSSKEFQKNAIWTSGGTDNMVPPRPIGRLSLKYPKLARESGIEASVGVEILISKEGKVSDVRIRFVSLSPDPGRDKESVLKAVFSDAVKKGLMKTLFVPLVVSGERRASCFTQVLQFKLDR